VDAPSLLVSSCLADEEHGTVLHVDHSLYGRDIVGQGTERTVGGDHIQTFCHQQRDWL
jgi:hypothetical protein